MLPTTCTSITEPGKNAFSKCWGVKLNQMSPEPCCLSLAPGLSLSRRGGHRCGLLEEYMTKGHELA